MLPLTVARFCVKRVTFACAGCGCDSDGK